MRATCADLYTQFALPNSTRVTIIIAMHVLIERMLMNSACACACAADSLYQPVHVQVNDLRRQWNASLHSRMHEWFPVLSLEALPQLLVLQYTDNKYHYSAEQVTCSHMLCQGNDS